MKFTDTLLTNTSSSCAKPSTLTLEELRKMLASLPIPEPDPLLFRPLRPSFAGLNIIERPLPPPKIQVSKEAEWIFTPKDLADTNAYLLERFGRYEQSQDLYHFGRYLSVPFGLTRDFSRIIGNFGA